jgi:hypothetical protein
MILNLVAFLPLSLRGRPHRNAMLLKTRKRTTIYLFYIIVRKAERPVLPAGSAAFIPAHECEDLSP